MLYQETHLENPVRLLFKYAEINTAIDVSTVTAKARPVVMSHFKLVGLIYDTIDK